MLRKTIAILSITSLSLLYSFEKTIPNAPILGTSNCPICNMDIHKYYKTSYVIIYKNGTKEHFCSISCMREKINTDILEVLVADAQSGALINTKNALFVIGSSVPSTMNEVSTLAFKTPQEANNFQATYGGKIGSFGDALNAR